MALPVAEKFFVFGQAGQAEKAPFIWCKQWPVELLRCWLPSYEDCKDVSKRQHLWKVSVPSPVVTSALEANGSMACDAKNTKIAAGRCYYLIKNSYHVGIFLQRRLSTCHTTHQCCGTKRTLHPTWPIVAGD